MEIDFLEFQEAFVKGKITFEQFVHVLIDNFGVRSAKSVVKKNLKGCVSAEEYKVFKSMLDQIMRDCSRI